MQKMSRLGPVGHALNTSLCLSSVSEVIKHSEVFKSFLGGNCCSAILEAQIFSKKVILVLSI